MNITSFDGLRYWFFGSQKATAEQSPHWSLYSTDYGKTDTRVAFNNRLDDMEEAYEALVKSIRTMNNPDGTRFRVQTHPVGKPNNPTVQTFVQVYEVNGNGAAQPAGIAGLPSMEGYISRAEVERLMKEERQKWEMQQEIQELKAAINAPPEDWTEKFITGFERIAQTPVGAVLLSKLMGGALPPMPPMAPMNGPPGAAAGGPEPDDDETFDRNLDYLSETLGMSDVEMTTKLRNLVQNDPEAAKAYFQTL